MGSLLKLITKLFGKNALGKTLGTRTNVIKLPNNEKKRLIKNELDIERASDAAAQKVLEEAKELIPDLPKMNDMERLVFEGNLRRLDDRLNPPSAEVVEFGTKKPMSEAGIKQLAAKEGLPSDVSPKSPLGNVLRGVQKLRKEKDELDKMMKESPLKAFEELVLKNPYRSGGPLDPKSGIVRTAARQILRKKLDEGQIDIPDAAERDAIAKGYQGGVDPIEVFRKRFGEDPLQDLDEIADELNRARDFKEIDKILKRNKLFDIEPKKDYGYQEGSYTDEEMAALLKKSEEDPEGFSKGGKVKKGSPKIFDQLEMDVPHPYGHRTKFQEGGIFSGPAYQQYSQARSQAYENAPSKFQYDVMSNQAAGQFLQDRTKEVMGNNMFSKIVGGIGSAAAIPFAVGASPFHEAIQAKERMEPGSGFRGYMKAFLNEQPLRTAMNRGIGVAASVPGVQQLGTSIGEGIYNLLNKGDVDPFSNFQKGSYGDPNYQKPTMADVAGPTATQDSNSVPVGTRLISDGRNRYAVRPDGSLSFINTVTPNEKDYINNFNKGPIEGYKFIGNQKYNDPSVGLNLSGDFLEFTGYGDERKGDGNFKYLQDINQTEMPRAITQDDMDTFNFNPPTNMTGPMFTGFDYSKEINWSPGQPAPDGYRVVNMMGDTFLERMYPSKEEVARLPGPGIVGPMGLMGLMGPEMMPSVNIPQDPDAGLSGQEYAEKYGLEYASGGRVGFALGSLPKGIQALAKQLNKKFGKGTIKTADEMERPKSVKEKEMFEEFESRNPNPKRKLTDDEIKYYEEELGDSETWMSEGTVEEAEQALKRQKEYEAAMYTDYKAGRLDPQPGEKGRKEFLEKKLEEMEMSGDKKIMSVDEIEELSNMDLEAEMNVAKSLAPKMVERFELKQKYPGITDELLDKILIDDNMQRKAEVLATLDEAFKMLEKGMGHDEVLDTLKNVTRTKQAGGGLAYLMGL